ncbi:MAG: ribonuclease HI [Firmicutes bacterium]|nr:ribonuclease HI [Bacillota bacterium]
MDLSEVVIYTDGACSGNPGPGGWAAVLIYGPHRKEVTGYEPATTNQRMELMAAIGALEALKRPCSVKLHSDSAYLINAFRQNWLGKWQRSGWLNSRKEPVENQDLWKRLLELTEIHRVQWVKVQGHADDELNNRCDYLARQAIMANADDAGK